MHQTTY